MRPFDSGRPDSPGSRVTLERHPGLEVVGWCFDGRLLERARLRLPFFPSFSCLWSWAWQRPSHRLRGARDGAASHAPRASRARHRPPQGWVICTTRACLSAGSARGQRSGPAHQVGRQLDTILRLGPKAMGLAAPSPRTISTAAVRHQDVGDRANRLEGPQSMVRMWVPTATCRVHWRHVDSDNTSLLFPESADTQARWCLNSAGPNPHVAVSVGRQLSIAPARTGRASEDKFADLSFVIPPLSIHAVRQWPRA